MTLTNIKQDKTAKYKPIRSQFALTKRYKTFFSEAESSDKFKILPLPLFIPESAHECQASINLVTLALLIAKKSV
jgi:hypothetical protein